MFSRQYLFILLVVLFVGCIAFFAIENFKNTEIASLIVDPSIVRPMPNELFGVVISDDNHAGSGGIWAELVDNRGFEAGGTIKPWSLIGNHSSIVASTDDSSCFKRNKVALRLDILCDSNGSRACPKDGVGVFNPGFWGMNIERGRLYKIVFYIRSNDSVDINVSLTNQTGDQVLASSNVSVSAAKVANWNRLEIMLEAKNTNTHSRLQLTTRKKGVIWIDQVSAMPMETYKGHGFRKDIVEKVLALEPRFLRFPVISKKLPINNLAWISVRTLRNDSKEWLILGESLPLESPNPPSLARNNAFRWKETVGPWEDRPGHFVNWGRYWSDDGLGYYEFLLLAEDLGVAPIWMADSGISRHGQDGTFQISLLVQEMLDGIEFARGDDSSKWGSLRATMGHPEPFQLKHIYVDNLECHHNSEYKREFMKFYDALENAYPDVILISKCNDALYSPMDHPTEMFDVDISFRYNATSIRKIYDYIPRTGSKAFVRLSMLGTSNMLAALNEAAILIALEINSDVIAAASYSYALENVNDDPMHPLSTLITYDSANCYSTASYWVQHFFRKSSGGILLKSTLQTNSDSLFASAVSWINSTEDKKYITIKVVNLQKKFVNLKLSIATNKSTIRVVGSKKTTFTSENVMDENLLSNLNKLSPSSTKFELSGNYTYIMLQPYSITAFDVINE